MATSMGTYKKIINYFYKTLDNFVITWIFLWIAFSEAE